MYVQTLQSFSTYNMGLNFMTGPSSHFFLISWNGPLVYDSSNQLHFHNCVALSVLGLADFNLDISANTKHLLLYTLSIMALEINLYKF